MCPQISFPILIGLDKYSSNPAVAAEIAKIKFPEIMLIGGDGKSGTPLESLIGAAMAKQLQTTKKKGN